MDQQLCLKTLTHKIDQEYFAGFPIEGRDREGGHSTMGYLHAYNSLIYGIFLHILCCKMSLS